MLRWQQAQGQRHAVDSVFPLRPEESFDTLCGQRLTTVRRDFPALGGSCTDPTCQDCDAEWRKRQRHEKPHPWFSAVPR